MKYLYLLLLIITVTFSQTTVEKERPKIGLVLSGGGAKGLAHIGVLKELERLGIRPDMITGTSMGAVIGGLYASGYSADELEKIVVNTDWEFLLTDQLDRDKLSIEEKDEDGKYFLNLPLENFSVKLPKGVVSGQNLSILLRQLCLPVSDIDDFNNLPIPFACFAIDIVTGEVVRLDKGSLPDAIRASMSIPSIFTPIKTEKNLLVDGGLTYNFPVEDVVKMGADIIIGVDVGTQMVNEEKLNSLFAIMDQTMTLQSDENNGKQQKLCDILIMPDVSNYGTASFGDSDSLIAKGFAATRDKLSELEKLQQKLSKYEKQKNLTVPSAPGGFHIYDIFVTGYKNVSENLIYGKLNLQEDKYHSIKDIEDAVLRLYGSQFFERVDYSLSKNKAGKDLNIRVIEKTPAMLRIGFYYDQNSKASLRFNTTMRNFLNKGSKLSLTGLLGSNPEISAKYLFQTGWKPDVGFEAETNFSNFDIDLFNEQLDDDETIGEARFDIYFAKASLRANLSRSLAIGGGIKYEYHDLDFFFLVNSVIDGTPYTVKYEHNETYGLLNYFVFLTADTFNKTIYPEKGVRFDVLFEEIPDLKRDIELTNENGISVVKNQKLRKFWRLKANYHQLVKISDDFTMGWKLRAGITSTIDIPAMYNFLLGGLTRDRDSFIPFSGFRLGEFNTTNFLMARIQLQYKIMPSTYLVFYGDVAKPADDYSDLLKEGAALKGYTVKVGYNTLIGPVELSIMGRNNSPHLHSQISIGVNF